MRGIDIFYLYAGNVLILFGIIGLMLSFEYFTYGFLFLLPSIFVGIVLIILGGFEKG